MSRKENPVDDALDDSFPASDPAAHSGTTASPTQAVIANAFDHAEISVWRVVEVKDKDRPFASNGRSAGRRWTSDEVEMVYAADSPATALLEWLAHQDGAPPESICLAEGKLKSELSRIQTALPSTWRDYPYRPEIQAIGDAWAESKESLALQVPSALCPDSFNYLINPAHAEAGSIRSCGTQEFRLDQRLTNQGHQEIAGT